VGLNLVLIPAHGALGAAIATCCSQVVMLLAQMAFAHGTGLDSRWWRLLSQPMFAAAAAAIVFALNPATAPFLVPLTVVLMLVMFRRAPTEEHRAVLRATRGSVSRFPTTT
jgi:O-antigen/teichoic acid export membrane protein